MGLEILSDLEILQGSLTLIMIIITIIIGIKIFLKYFATQLKTFFTAGLAWILLSSGWWGASLTFLILIFSDYVLDTFTYLLLSNALIPFALLCWMYSFLNLINSKFKKQIIIVYLIISIVFEIFLISFLFIDTNLVATKSALFETRRTLFTQSFLIFGILSALISGIIFARISMKDKKPMVQWKGKFLLLAFILFALGAFLDSSIPRDPLTLILFRLILVFSSIFYYFGLFLPKWLEKSLVKEK